MIYRYWLPDCGIRYVAIRSGDYKTVSDQAQSSGRHSAVRAATALAFFDVSLRLARRVS